MLTNFTLEDEKSLRQWLQDVREGAGYVGILDKEGWSQRHFNDTEEFLGLVDTNKLSCNLYVSMACFKSSDLSRSQDNATKLCSFWLDIDSHGGGKYDSPEDALLDACNFIRDSNLPTPSYIHHTGHGIHIVWATNQTMPPSEWLPIAQALRDLAEGYGLDVDGELTTDAARVLRIPYTINFRIPSSPVVTKLLEVNKLCQQ